MEEDRRRHRRFPLKLSILCQKVGLSGGELVSGRTVNVSPGGMLVKVNGGDVAEGELLSIEMSVPLSEGLLDFGGMLSSHARVVRSDNHGGAEESSEKVVALEFCDSPTLRT
jgi:c-di-GMP-binding flagellar brake protein YcgR